MSDEIRHKYEDENVCDERIAKCRSEEVFDKRGNFIGYVDIFSDGTCVHYNQDHEETACTTSRLFDYNESEEDDED